MKWLPDEMLPAATCRPLALLGYDAVHVRDVGLAGAEDDRVFAHPDPYIGPHWA